MLSDWYPSGGISTSRSKDLCIPQARPQTNQPLRTSLNLTFQVVLRALTPLKTERQLVLQKSRNLNLVRTSSTVFTVVSKAATTLSESQLWGVLQGRKLRTRRPKRNQEEVTETTGSRSLNSKMKMALSTRIRLTEVSLTTILETNRSSSGPFVVARETQKNKTRKRRWQISPLNTAMIKRKMKTRAPKVREARPNAVKTPKVDPNKTSNRPMRRNTTQMIS